MANRLIPPHPRLVRLDVADLLKSAVRNTGLSDFGADDFLEPLRVLIRACDTEAALTFVGRLAARRNILRLLEQRLSFEDYWKRHPEIAREPIRRPLFILSLARSGTTLLHRLLAQDPGSRVPLCWELMFPIPPPERLTYETDARIARAERELHLFDRFLVPHLRRVHELGARLPEECLMIMASSFRSFQFTSMYDIPSYQEWMEQHDLGPGYAYHRRVLQTLQWRCPGDRWVLKAPAHIFGIDEIFANYPDASIIHIHRDPLEVTASLASLTAAIYSAFGKRVDLHRVGRDVVECMHRGVARYLRVRDRDAARQSQFLDLDYRAFTADPMTTVRQIYRFLGLSLAAPAEARMARFLRENPKDKHGHHPYSLTQFAIDPEAETSRFKGYRDRFRV
jgi:hypothetical protein